MAAANLSLQTTTVAATPSRWLSTHVEGPQQKSIEIFDRQKWWKPRGNCGDTPSPVVYGGPAFSRDITLQHRA